MSRDAGRSQAEAHMDFSVISEEPRRLLSPHQDPGNCPAVETVQHPSDISQEVLAI